MLWRRDRPRRTMSTCENTSVWWISCTPQALRWTTTMFFYSWHGGSGCCMRSSQEAHEATVPTGVAGRLWVADCQLKILRWHTHQHQGPHHPQTPPTPKRGFPHHHQHTSHRPVRLVTIFISSLSTPLLGNSESVC